MNTARHWTLVLFALFVAGSTFAADDKKTDAKKPDASKAAEKKAEPAQKEVPKKASPVAAPAKAPEKKAEPKKDAKQPEVQPVAASSGQVSFVKDVAPILIKNCMACHGPRDPKGQYQLHTYEAFAKSGESGEASVKPGKPAESYLYTLVASNDSSDRMPKDADPLKKEQIELIKKWIEQGAKFDGPSPKAELVQIVPKLPHPSAPEKYRVPVAVTAVAFNPAGTELAVAGYHEVTIWDAAKVTLLRRIGNVDERVYGLAYSPDGKTLAVASGTPGQTGEVALYDPTAGKLTKSLATLGDVVFCVAYNTAGTKLAASAADRSIRVFDVVQGTQERLIEDHADWVMTVAFDLEGNRLVSGSRDKTSKVFDLKTGEAVATFPGHSETVFCAAFTADGKSIVSGGADKKVHTWNPTDGKAAGNVAGFGGDVYKLVMRKDKFYTSSGDKNGRQHELADRKILKTYAGLGDYAFALDEHEATKRVAVGGFDGQVIVFDLEKEKENVVAKFVAAPGYAPPTVSSAKK